MTMKEYDIKRELKKYFCEDLANIIWDYYYDYDKEFRQEWEDRMLSSRRREYHINSMIYGGYY